MSVCRVLATGWCSPSTVQQTLYRMKELRKRGQGSAKGSRAIIIIIIIIIIITKLSKL
jgi:hypothetical protein